MIVIVHRTRTNDQLHDLSTTIFIS